MRYRRYEIWDLGESSVDERTYVAQKEIQKYNTHESVFRHSSCVGLATKGVRVLRAERSFLDDVNGFL